MKIRLPNIGPVARLKFKKRVVVVFWSVVTIGLMAFVQKRQEDRICNRVVIDIDNQHENFFIEQEDVMSLMTGNGKDDITGQVLRLIDLKKLEDRIKFHGFVEDAEVHSALNGDLLVTVTQCKPVLRLSTPDGDDRYVSATGRILPLSDRYTARVMVVHGVFVSRLSVLNWQNDTLAKPYFELAEKIREDKFYQTMFPEMHIDSNGEITLLPQVGRLEVDFGKPELLEEKLKKLDILYRKILPAKGWATYKKATLKYDKQIICE